MEQQFVSSELYSHEGKLLEVHLLEVAKLANHLISDKPVDLQQKNQGDFPSFCFISRCWKGNQFFSRISAFEKERRPREKAT